MLLGPRCAVLLPNATQDRHHSLGFCSDLLQALRELFPNSRHPQEHCRPNEGQSVLERALLQVVIPREIHGPEPSSNCSERDGQHDIHQEAGNVREGQVGDQTLLVVLHPDGGARAVQRYLGVVAHVIVRKHHGLGQPSRSRSVHQTARVSWLHGSLPHVHLLVCGLIIREADLADADERIPRHYLHWRAILSWNLSSLRGSPIQHNGLQLGHFFNFLHKLL
mmetsp:Transcript_4383/g.9466  ORF Transcript_4383/g.9466 Transcript_4383/m.9466 type:complete len:222 (-) Transcript_4383:1800-2465(-)